MSNSPRGKSYSQVMNEWAAQRSFINRWRSRLIHPPYDAPWYGKIWGYLWRLSLVCGTVGIVSYVALNRNIRSAGYRAHLAEEISKKYNATNVTIGKTKAALFSERCMINAIGADGAAGCKFSRLDAYDIGFDLGFQFLRTDWTIDRLYVNRLAIALRTGDLATMETLPSAPTETLTLPDRVVVPDFKTSSIPPKTHLKTAGFGLSPNLSELTIGAYDISELTASWGYSTTTAGRLEDATTTIDPTENNGWSFLATNGKLSQNWLTNLEIDRLVAEKHGETINIKQAAFTHGGQGHIVMNGSVTWNERPELNLVMLGQGVNLKSFTPAPFNKYFDATADFEGKITGTVAVATGVQTRVKVKLTAPQQKLKPAESRPLSEPAAGGRPTIAYLANNIPLLRALYVASGEDRLMQVAITEGSFDLETGGGTMRITNLDIQSGDLFKMKGTIEAVEELEAAMAPTSIIPDANQAPKLIYRARGELLIGLNPETVRVMPKIIQERYFTQESEGFIWMRAPFQDEDGHDISRGIGEEISRLQKESLVERPR